MSGGGLGIVFLHHRSDAVTLNNLQSFREWNPGATMVTMSAEEALPGGYSIREMEGWAERWREHTSREWLRARSTDLLVYAWYANRREQCERWVLVEWDAFCACSVEEYFGGLMKRDVVGGTVRVPGDNDEPWYWFRERETLPEALRESAAGIVPFSFILVSNHALSAMCEMLPEGDLGNGNGELRFASLARAAGFQPLPNRVGEGRNDWQPIPEGTPLGRGMWHPVKWLVGKENVGALTKFTERPTQRKPWMDARELAVMERLLKREDRMLEFGAGGSTAWLAGRVRELYSVEHNEEWVGRIIDSLPENVTLHLCPPVFPHKGFEPALPGQFVEYVRTPECLGVVFDACLVDGRSRIECALAAAPWIKSGGLLFFHDWFPRLRYTSRLAELEPFYELREEWCVRDSPQTLAVFVRRTSNDSEDA